MVIRKQRADVSPAFRMVSDLDALTFCMRQLHEAQGVSVDVRPVLLGHIPRVNEMNYTCDMMLLKEKMRVVERADKR